MSGLGLRFWRRQVGAEWSILATIAISAAIAALLLAVTPRLVEHASRDDLREAITSATPEQRNIRFEMERRQGAGSRDDPFNYVNREGELAAEQSIPEAVAAIIDDQEWVFSSPEFTVTSFPDRTAGPFPTTFTFRYQSGIEAQSTLVDGRLPRPAEPVFRLEGPECPDDDTDPREFVPEPEQQCAQVRLAVFEAAVTAKTAEDMMVEVGDSLTLTPATDDAKWRNVGGHALNTRLILRISGLVELSDPTLEYWYADRSLHRPNITENSDYRLVFAAGLMDPAEYRPFLRAVQDVNFAYTYRYVVDSERIANADIEELGAELEKIGPDNADVITLLPDVLADHVAQRRLTLQLTAIAAAGLVAAALATVLVLSLLRSNRLRASTELVVDRGASSGQVRLNAALVAACVVVPSTALAWLIAAAVLPDTDGKTSTQLVVAFALALVVTIVATALPSGDNGEQRVRRIVIETMLLTVAVGATLLLRRRAGTDEPPNFDPLLVFAPVLLSVAAGTLVIRALTPLVKAAAMAATRRRDLAWFVGLRRLETQPLPSRLPLAVLTMATAGAVLASVLASSLAAGQETAAWQEVGGDYRVTTINETVPLPRSVDASTFGSGRAFVSGVELRGVRASTEVGVNRVDLIALDTEEYQRLVADEKVATTSVDALIDQDDMGRFQPAIAVGAWPIRAPLAPGDSVMVDVGGYSPLLFIVATTDRFPGVPVGRFAIIVDRARLEQATDARTAQATFVLLDGSADDEPALREVIETNELSANLIPRHTRFEAIAGDPFSKWTNRTLRAVGALSAALVGIAAVAAVLLSAADRRRDIGLLRVLGLRSNEGAIMTLIEHAPGAIVSVVVGAGSGIVTAKLLEPAIALEALSGGVTPVGVAVELVVVATLIAAIGLMIVIAVSATIRSLRRSGDATILKEGDR